MNALTRSDIKSRLCSFFLGRYYPPIICFIVFLGCACGLEVLSSALIVTLSVSALFLTGRIKPLLISFMTFFMQISIKHAPGYPTNSDYIYTSSRLVYCIIMGAVIFSAFLIFFIKYGIYRKINLKSPIFISNAVFSVLILFNGAFSGGWVFSDLIFAFVNSFAYLGFFIIFYCGLADEADRSDAASVSSCKDSSGTEPPRAVFDEGRDGLKGYVAYLSVLASLTVICELIVLFLTNDNIFVGGSINKVEVALGWGIWNLVGVTLVVLIPMIFYGMHYNRRPWLYFAAATLTYLAAVVTMSRNALIFGTLAYGLCVVVSCFFGKNKKAFRIITLVGITAALLVFILFFDKIYGVLLDYFNRGFSDNGRFALWGAAVRNFLDSPVFGGGFYGFDVDTAVFGFLPKMAHNTVLQLLSATGILGLISYAVYRYFTLTPLFRDFSLKKFFMGLSVAVLLLAGLLDNFMFNIYPLIYYNIIISILHLDFERANKLFV